MEEDPGCTCARGKFGDDGFEEKYLGMDDHFGGISLVRCERCRQLWLRYYYVNEPFSKSGRWYHGLIPQEVKGSITIDNALAVLGQLEWYWCGASWYDGNIVKGRGHPDLFP